MVFWQPMASIETTAPCRSSNPSSSGMAVISFDFSATARWASTQRARPAKALTRCTAGLAPSRLPRSAFPSMQTCSFPKPGSAAVALLDPSKPFPGSTWHPWIYLREVVLLGLVGLSLVIPSMFQE